MQQGQEIEWLQKKNIKEMYNTIDIIASRKQHSRVFCADLCSVKNVSSIEDNQVDVTTRLHKFFVAAKGSSVSFQKTFYISVRAVV